MIFSRRITDRSVWSLALVAGVPMRELHCVRGSDMRIPSFKRIPILSEIAYRAVYNRNGLECRS